MKTLTARWGEALGALEPAPAREGASRLAPPRGRAPSLQERAVGLRQWAVMIQAGLPLTRCAEVLASPSSPPGLAAAWRAVRGELERGRRLSDCLAGQPSAFEPLLVGLVRVAEESGRLGEVLGLASNLWEREARIHARLRAALIYPAIVSLACLGVALGLVLHVVPLFLQGLLQGQAELPWITRALLAWIALARSPSLWTLAVGGAGLGGWLLQRYRRSPLGRYREAQLLLRLPGWGGIQRRSLMARCCRTLALLIQGGVLPLRALDLTGQALDHPLLEEALAGVRADLVDGLTLGEAFRGERLFPAMVSGLILASEGTPALPRALEQLAGLQEEELEWAVPAMLAVLEPLLVAGLGVLVGGVVLALALPLRQVLMGL